MRRCAKALNAARRGEKSRVTMPRTQSCVFAGQVNPLDNLIALTGGLRRDEAFIAETNYVRDARGLFSAGAHGGTRGGGPQCVRGG